MDEVTIKKLHNVELDILSTVDAICRENGLTYYLMWGTLLGAVRHQGFIPWDDDIDIGMPRKDYDRFIEICKKNDDFLRGGQYEVHDISTDSHYWNYYAKIRRRGTLFVEKEIEHLDCPKGIFIDVFPMDYVRKTEGLIFNVRSQVMRHLFYTVYRRVLNAERLSFLGSLFCLVTRFLSVKMIYRLERLVAKTCRKGKNYIVYHCITDYQRISFPVSWFGKPEPIEFEGKIFYAPKEKEKLLRQVYGDYMKLPPIKERKTHNPLVIQFDE